MEAEIYPQVLRVDLKSSFGSYFTVVERFANSEEYIKYCDNQLWSGYKVIGTRPYNLKPKENESTEISSL
jgi:hypothetical protein